MLSGSAVSMRTAPRSGCSAVMASRSSVRRPPTMTVLPLAFNASASANPMPLVDPGMKMVLPEICTSDLLSLNENPCLELPLRNRHDNVVDADRHVHYRLAVTPAGG